MAQAVSRRPQSGGPDSRPGQSLWDLWWVDKVALEHVYLRVLRFLLSTSLHRRSPYSHIIWVMNIRPADGRRSLTQSHPINMNNEFRLLGCRAV
jgi:hypothetical protein